MNRKIMAVSWLAAALLGAASAQAETIYKWIDENGTVHYSNERPPSHVKASVVDTTEPVRAEPVSQPAQSQPRTEPAAPPADMQTPEPQSQRPSLKEQEAAFAERRAARLEQEAREAQEQDSARHRMARACDRARSSLARTVAAPPRLAQKKGPNDADVWVYRGEQSDVPSINNAERSEAIGVLEAFIAKNCEKRNRQ
jgi:hypothetical protein